MKARSFFPRRWRQTAPAAASHVLAVKPTARAWSLEALEPRVLLSADPVLGAVHIALLPADGGADLHLGAFHAVAEPVDQHAALDAAVLIAAGHSQIGQPGSSQAIVVDAGKSAAVQASGDLVLWADGPSGHVSLNSNLSAASIQINGSGHTTVLNADSTATTGNNTFNDSVRVSGDRLVAATLGSVILGGNNTHFLSGDSAATTDKLRVSAAGNVTFNAVIGQGEAGTDVLSGLSVISGGNVSFEQSVTVAGDLVIDATGIVTFKSTLTIKNGGSLTILHADQIVMKGAVSLQLNGATTPGSILLEGDEIDLFEIGEELITGSGSVTLRPATVGEAIAIFSPSGQATANTLNLDSTDMRAFAEGFSSFTIGHQSGGHALATAGAVLVGASTAPDSLALRDPLTIYGGSITIADYSTANAILRLGAGDTLKLDARGDITIYNEVEADQINLYSAVGKILQLDATSDTRSSEPLRALGVTAVASTGVGLTSLEVQTLSVTNTGQGNISLGQNAVRTTTRFPTEITGDIAVTQLIESASSGVNSISLLARAGSINLSAGPGISLAGDGGLTLTAQGTGSDISLLAPISLRGGPVTLSAADAFTASAAAPITATGASAISISAGTGNLTLGAAVSTVGGSLTLASGGALDLSGITLDAGPSGAIALQSVGDLRVGIISASASISLTSTGGAIIDALTGDAANLRGEAAAVTLVAANGVGSGSAPLRSSVGTLTGSVSGSTGGIFIAEETALGIAAGGLSTAGSGAIVVRTTTGDLTSLGAVRATGSGHVLLEAMAAGLSLQGDVLAQGGSISLLAAGAVFVTGTEVRSRGANQTLDLRAGTSIGLGATTTLATANGNQRLQASFITLGSVDAGTATVSLVASVNLAAAPAASLTAGALRIQAGGSVGTGAEPLQLRVARLAVSAGTSLFLNELDDIQIASVTDPSINRVGSGGALTVLSPAGTVVGLTAGAAAVLNAGGAINVDAAITAASNLRLSAGASLAVNAAVVSTAGQLSLLAVSAISHTAAGTLSTSGGAIDEQAGTSLTMAAGTTLASNGGRLRLLAGGALTLGQLNAGTGEAWLQGSRITAASGSSAVDLIASDARLIATGTGAGDGLGLSTDALSLQVQRLAVQSAGLSGVFLSEGDAITVDSIAATSGSRVQADGSVAALSADAALAGLSAGAAPLSLAAGGNLTINAAVSAQRLRLDSAGDLRLQAAVSTTTGVLSLNAGQDLLVQANLSGPGGLDLLAGRNLLMNSGVSASALASSALRSGRDLRVAVVDVGASKALYLESGGSLSDADAAGDTTVNLRAGKLVLIAAVGIGQSGNAIETAASYLGASSGAGVFIDEADSLNINAALPNNFGAPQRVAADGSVLSLSTVEVQGLITSNAPLVLRLLAGALSIDAAVRNEVGAIRLEAATLTLNAGVTSANAAISLLAGGAVAQGAAGSISSSGGSIDAQAGGAWTMAQGSQITSGGAAVRLAATGALSLAKIDAGSGALSLSASQVKDITGDLVTDPDLVAGSLRLRTTGSASTDGVGAGADAIEIAVQRLAVDSAGGGIFLAQTGDLSVDGLAAFDGARVQLDGSVLAGAVSDGALAGLRSTASLVLRGSGALSINAASSATGTVLLSSSTDLGINAALSGAAALSLNAGRDLLLNANLSSTGSTRSVDLVAGRDMAQAQGTAVQTVNGAIALQAGRDVTLETLTAGTAGVAVIAAGAILDGDTAGDSETDITAASLRLTAGGSVGTAANALETAVSTLSASAASLSLSQPQALAIGSVSTSLQRVAGDGSTQVLDLAAQEDLSTTAGPLLLSLSSGDLTLNGGSATPAQVVSSAGALLLRAVSASLLVNSGVSAAGNTSLRAGANIGFAAAGDVSLAGAASLDAEAGGAISMADGAVLLSAAGNLRLAAALDLSIGALQTAGDISLLARNISDAGAAETDITARSLRVFTTGGGTTQGFGTGAAPVQLQVGSLAASIAGTGAGGFFAAEADALRVDSVAVSVNRITADGSSSTVADAALSDLVSSGNVVLITGGALTLSDGSNADGTGLQSGGNVLLDVIGDLTVGAAVRSSSGAISLLATGNLGLNADLAITRTGRTVDVQAGGTVTMAPTTSVSSVDSNVRIQAGADLTVSAVNAGLGSVSLIATAGSISESGSDAGAEVSAAALRLNAAVGVGSASESFDTAVQRISARAAGGGIWLLEADAVTITDVAVAVRRVSSAATTAVTISDDAQSDLITTAGNGSILLATSNGNISFLDGSAPADGRSVTAHGSGSVTLSAGGPGAVLSLPAGTIQQQGPVVIDSGLKFDGAVTLTAGQGGARGDGTIRIGGAIDGSAGGGADVLVLNSDGADVIIGGAIGGTDRLGGLTINDARNVSFAQDVKLAGDLTLQASGRVEFKGALDLSSGALNIVGASQLVIGNVVITSGNAVLHVDALTLSGLISGAAGASLELAGASASSGVVVGGATGTGLALSAAQLAAVQGFGQVQIGRSDQGATAVEAAALAGLATPRLNLAGASLSLTGAAGATLSAALQLLKLSAAQDLNLAGSISLAAAGADVLASAGGALRMATDGVLLTQAGDVQLQATGDLQIGRIDTRGSGGSPAAVVLASTGGTITEANADALADVFADLFTLRGRGPLLTPGSSSNAAALDVQANKLDVDAPSGVILRDSSPDGRTAINLFDAGQLRQQLIALGAPPRQASAAGQPPASVPSSADAWAWLSTVRPLQESRESPFAGAVGFVGGSLFSAHTTELRATSASTETDASGPLSRLLGLSLDSGPAFATEATPQATRFRIWSEELSL